MEENLKNENSLKSAVDYWNNLMKPYLIPREDREQLTIEEANAYLTSHGLLEEGISRAKSLEIEDDSTILEIGPGPGIMTLVFLEKCKKLMAVEPEKAMLQVLEKRAAKAGFKNLETYHGFWEDFESDERYDYIISSLSIMFSDILEGIKKMDKLAKKRVYIYWFDSENRMERQNRIAKEIFDIQIESPNFPKLEQLEPILKGLDLDYKKVKLPDMKFDDEWKTLESIKESIRSHYNLKNDDEKIMQYVEKLYIIEGDMAKYIDKTEFALIYWNK